MILYFTGTGNSKYVATQLAKKLDDKVIEVNDYIKNGQTPSFESEKPWIFVFPIYISNIINIFADFLKKATFNGNKSAYFVATCVSAYGSAPNECKKICNKQNLEYKGIDKILMPQSYIALFKSTPEQECIKRYKDASIKIDDIANLILSNQNLDMTFVSNIEYVMTKWIEDWYYRDFTKTKKFYANDNCTTCGLCQLKCPLNNIKIEGGKPKWTGNCVHCMACINHCPKTAIEYGTKTIGKKRYVCTAAKILN